MLLVHVFVCFARALPLVVEVCDCLSLDVSINVFVRSQLMKLDIIFEHELNILMYFAYILIYTLLILHTSSHCFAIKSSEFHSLSRSITFGRNQEQWDIAWLGLCFGGRLRQLVSSISSKWYELCHKKTCLRGLRPGKTQTGLLSLRNWLEA